MEIKMLDQKYHTDGISGCLCRYVRSDTEYFRPHYHNFYEIFMVVKGTVCHKVNGHEQILHEGHILFVRDFDCHDYISENGEYFELVNLAFSFETFRALKEYLGTGFPFDILLKSELPPTVYLTPSDKEKLFSEFMDINVTSDKELAKIKMRTLVLDIFTGYFLNYHEKASSTPLWLEKTYEKMKSPDNFILGLSKMCEISDKSREHLSRSMKTYYNITPCEYITKLRLEYSANLLVTTSMSVTDVCYESGFENLSWFYKIFSKKFNMTPTNFRKTFSTN